MSGSRLAVHGGLGEIAAELRQQRAFLGTLRHLFALRTRQFFANGGKPQSALVQNLGGEALLFAQQAQQQVLGADVLVIQPLGLFRAISQHALALVAQRQIDRSGNLLADRGVPFDLLADGFHGGVRPQEAVGQRLILAQQPQQQVLGLDVRAAELAGLVPREEDYSSRFLRIALKHNRSDAPYNSKILRPASRLRNHW